MPMENKPASVRKTGDEPDLSWQSGFLQQIRNPATPAAVLQDLFLPPFEAGLNLYRNSQTALRRQVLGRAYPVVRELIGDACFFQLAGDFAAVNPSLSGDLHEYGEQFAGFLQQCAWLAEYPYLPAVAALEWKLHCLYYAAQTSLLTLPVLVQQCAGDVVQLMNVQLRFSANASLLRTKGNSAQIWLWHSRGQTGSLQWSDAPCYAAISRPEWLPVVTELSEEEYRCLQALSEGQTLGSALGLLLDGAALSAEHYIQQLMRWMALGLFDVQTQG